MIHSATASWPGTIPGTILLSHATGFCKETWRPVIEELRSRPRVPSILAWDYYNHGASGRLPRPIDWWDFGEQARKLIADTTRPRVGVGHSMGGAALVMAELIEPGLLDRLVLVDPIIFPPPYRRFEGPMSEVAIKRRSSYDSTGEARANFAEKDVFAGWDPRALDGYVEGGLRPAPGGFVLACSPEDEADVFAGASAHGAFDRLGEVTAPTVIVIGEHSDTHDAAAAELLVSRLGGPARWTRFDGTSHFVPMEQPARLATVILGSVSDSVTDSID